MGGKAGWLFWMAIQVVAAWNYKDGDDSRAEAEVDTSMFSVGYMCRIERGEYPYTGGVAWIDFVLVLDAQAGC